MAVTVSGKSCIVLCMITPRVTGRHDCRSGGEIGEKSSNRPIASRGMGLVMTVVQLFRRKPGWPFAVATFVLSALAVVLGGVGYAMAVG
jgi:hypothetical protein